MRRIHYAEARNFNENLKDTYRLIYRKKRLYALDRQIEAELKAARKNGRVITLERGFCIMTTQEVLDKLLRMGIKISERTLRNYASQGLIGTPERKNLGRGTGKIVNWGDCTPDEVAASWMLMHNFGGKPSYVSHIRTFALLVEKNMNYFMENGIEVDQSEGQRELFISIANELLRKTKYNIPHETKIKILSDTYIWLSIKGKEPTAEDEVLMLRTMISKDCKQ